MAACTFGTRGGETSQARWQAASRLGNLPRNTDRDVLGLPEDAPVYAASGGYLIVAVKARHASPVNASIGPLRSVVSRTSTAPAEATSTHSPPLDAE